MWCILYLKYISQFIVFSGADHWQPVGRWWTIINCVLLPRKIIYWLLWHLSYNFIINFRFHKTNWSTSLLLEIKNLKSFRFQYTILWNQQKMLETIPNIMVFGSFVSPYLCRNQIKIKIRILFYIYIYTIYNTILIE